MNINFKQVYFNIPSHALLILSQQNLRLPQTFTVFYFH